MGDSSHPAAGHERTDHPCTISRVAGHVLSGTHRQTTTKNPQSADMDLERVARAVYDLLEQRLRIERENRGL